MSEFLPTRNGVRQHGLAGVFNLTAGGQSARQPRHFDPTSRHRRGNL
jgi:hypothetical protein